MPHSRRNEIARQFAEGLVAQMLERCGNEFSWIHHSRPGDPINFLVRNGTHICAIGVQYAEHSDGIRKLWKQWKQTKPVAHLIVVTGRGDEVYVEETVAPLLAADTRTHITLLAG
ncbi:hypothetical protein [Herbaspirillum rubrisubalbicans]|uniref:hypothetical protein n=1 Tax=Herbaspirillum rubrisubalbicans TaxID=80842 RepID=UPI0012F7000A|nr:hypothetical protein [Herbaspirillum rubrisubalbicans]MCP1575021.1 hypothetical protein [Herbaspirillum rubrisubalbicans]